MRNNLERIKCSAIKYRLKDEIEYKYMLGKSHADCIHNFLEMNIPAKNRDMKTEVQGFMTNTGRFVNRQEAKEIAIKSGQVSEDYSYKELFSEFVKDLGINIEEIQVTDDWYTKQLEYWETNPEKFVEDILGLKLLNYQKNYLKRLVDKNES